VTVAEVGRKRPGRPPRWPRGVPAGRRHPPSRTTWDQLL